MDKKRCNRCGDDYDGVKETAYTVTGLIVCDKCCNSCGTGMYCMFERSGDHNITVHGKGNELICDGCGKPMPPAEFYDKKVY